MRNLFKRYFDLRTDKVSEAQVIANIKADASFRGANLWVLIFAIFVASLGLNVNSTAVIIGAMLISPLMGPIVGMGLAFGINDLDLLKSSAKNFAVATVVSVLTATFFFILSPYKEVQSELLARTSPTLYDVLIAFFGGAAGIVTITTGGKGNVIPGVAIATALMPPLCTAGYGLATGQLMFFLGAFYLFFINTVFISLATFFGVFLMGFEQKQELTAEQRKRTRQILTAIVILTMLPASFITVRLVHQSISQQNVARFVKQQLSWPGTQVISQYIDADKHLLQVAIIGRQVEDSAIAQATHQLADYHLANYSLTVIQGSQSDSLSRLVGQLQTSKDTYTEAALQQNQQIHELKEQLASYESLTSLSEQLRPELQVLYPHIQSISLAHSLEVRTDTLLTQPVTLAVVTMQSHQVLTSEHLTQLKAWLSARTAADSLRLVVGQ